MKVEVRRAGDARGAARVRGDHGEGGGDGAQVERCRVVGQMVHRGRPILRRACCAGLR